jgi:hypothetical protein
MHLHLETARKANVALLHNAVTSLPVPTLSAGAGIFTVSPATASLLDTSLIPVSLRGDLIFYPSVSPLVINSPVHLWARVNTTGAANTWVKVETIEVTSMTLTEGPSSYRIKLSPWWDRIAIAAPAWTPGAGENVTVRMFRWWS